MLHDVFINYCCNMLRRQFSANVRQFVSFVVWRFTLRYINWCGSSFTCMINIKIEIVFVNLLFPSWSWSYCWATPFTLTVNSFLGGRNMSRCCRKMCHLALNSVCFNLSLSFSLSLPLLISWRFYEHEIFTGRSTVVCLPTAERNVNRSGLKWSF
jgi:hypothetical protein